MKNPLRNREQGHNQKHRGKVCIECGVDEFTVYEVVPNLHYTGLSSHHLLPVSKGGSRHNGLATLCEKCHRAIHTVEGKFSWRHVNQELTEKYKRLLGID